MLSVITGGSGSGKSAFAEDYLLRIGELCQKYYIATMQIYDEEGQKKVERHRTMRAGKGFCTIEQPVQIECAAEKLQKPSGSNVALLECMSNLTANEMFTPEGILQEAAVTEKIIAGVAQLNAKLTHLVIVTNNVFEDGITYDDTTMEYIRAMGTINAKLAAMADEVIEVVVGISIEIKGKGRTGQCR